MIPENPIAARALFYVLTYVEQALDIVAVVDDGLNHWRFTHNSNCVLVRPYATLDGAIMAFRATSPPEHQLTRTSDEVTFLGWKRALTSADPALHEACLQNVGRWVIRELTAEKESETRCPNP